MKLEWKITPSDEHKLVRDYLLHDRAFSNRLLKHVKKDGKILIDGDPVTVKHQLKSGQVLTVYMPDESKNENIEPINMNLKIVYEDDYLIIINKPRGLAVLPNMNDKVTLANGLINYYNENQINSTIHIVTRIDKWTSGLVLIAKNRYIHYLLSKQDIHREYRAVIEGKLQKEVGTIDLPIARNLPSIIERKVDINGKKATTHFQVLKEMSDCSLIAVTLDTGRTHQIRVHFSHIGHPLVGDDLYGATQRKIKGQALHARSLKFKHPIRGNIISSAGFYPIDIQRLINLFQIQT